MLKNVNYSTLIIFSIVLGLAPFTPEPHIWQKLKMLYAGTLVKPLDIFDLVFHSAPIGLLIIKYVSARKAKKQEAL